MGSHGDSWGFIISWPYPLIPMNPGVDSWVKINPHESPWPMNPSTPVYGLSGLKQIRSLIIKGPWDCLETSKSNPCGTLKVATIYFSLDKWSNSVCTTVLCWAFQFLLWGLLPNPHFDRFNFKQILTKKATDTGPFFQLDTDIQPKINVPDIDTQNWWPDIWHSTSARHWQSHFQVDAGHYAKFWVNIQHSDPCKILGQHTTLRPPSRALAFPCQPRSTAKTVVKLV